MVKVKKVNRILTRHVDHVSDVARSFSMVAAGVTAEEAVVGRPW
jgi:hypothetical protein